MDKLIIAALLSLLVALVPVEGGLVFVWWRCSVKGDVIIIIIPVYVLPVTTSSIGVKPYAVLRY